MIITSLGTRRARDGSRVPRSAALHHYHPFIPSRSSHLYASQLHPTTRTALHSAPLNSPISSNIHTTLAAMASKRKRSADDSPLSICSFGAASTPEAQSPAPFSSNGWDFTSASRVKSGDWGNRTRKRFRDNRPDEHTIHGMLLRRLERGDLILTVSRKHDKQAIRRPT
jgi:hypothetical protein